MALSTSPSGVHFEAFGEEETKRGTVFPAKKMIAWEPRQEVLGFWVDTEYMTAFLP